MNYICSVYFGKDWNMWYKEISFTYVLYKNQMSTVDYTSERGTKYTAKRYLMHVSSS